MKVLIANVTGSQKDVAELDTASGILVFENGNISHVAYEKSFNKNISIVKDEPEEAAALIEEPVGLVVTSPEQSDVSKKKEKKRK